MFAPSTTEIKSKVSFGEKVHIMRLLVRREGELYFETYLPS